MYRAVHCATVVAALSAQSPASLRAQSVEVVAPAQAPLRTVTPAFTIRALGLGAARPVSYTLQVGTNANFVNGLLTDTTISSNNTEITVQTTRLLPSDATIFWRAIVRTDDSRELVSPVAGPRRVLPWLTLLSPNSSGGDQFAVRRPPFIWRAPSIAPSVGEWRYDFELVLAASNRVELTATLVNDTVFIPPSNLQANTSYRWNVRATAHTGQSVREFSEATFSIVDPALPTTTILYQNFPNPFPTARAFATCFWFDVGEPGARISLEVLDMRGNLVRTIIPGDDGQVNFPSGRYGRGIPGLGNNCDNRFVWNGTGNDGRTVAAGSYLLRFVADNARPVFKTIVFRGR